MRTTTKPNGTVVVTGTENELRALREHYWSAYKISPMLYLEGWDPETGEELEGYPRVEIHPQTAERMRR